MAATRPFKFGAKATKAGSAKEWADLAKQAEDLGFVSFQMDDHFGNQLAPVPAIMAAASATSSIKVGPLVAGVDFRNPVVFAKEAATIDLLSEGRFMMALGAGWLKDDYAIAGIGQDDALTRIERLGEAIDVMRGLWGEGKFSYEGKHYTVAEVDGKPAPVSDIPILVGGGGREDPVAGGAEGRHRRHQPQDRGPLHQPEVDGHGGGRRRRPEAGLGEGGGR